MFDFLPYSRSRRSRLSRWSVSLFFPTPWPPISRRCSPRARSRSIPSSTWVWLGISLFTPLIGGGPLRSGARCPRSSRVTARSSCSRLSMAPQWRQWRHGATMAPWRPMAPTMAPQWRQWRQQWRQWRQQWRQQWRHGAMAPTMALEPLYGATMAPQWRLEPLYGANHGAMPPTMAPQWRHNGASQWRHRRPPVPPSPTSVCAATLLVTRDAPYAAELGAVRLWPCPAHC